MITPDFPNGFESWQKTHFEVVEVLVYIRELESDQHPKGFSEALDLSATDELYKLALDLTNKYEQQTKGKIRTRTLFDDIEEYVHEELSK